MASDDLLGTTVGRYQLEALLGEGGMGRVYLGVDRERATRVAIKVLQAQTPELVERFAAEARAVSLISHFNIVNLIDLSALPDGRPYMVMELVEGKSLREVAPEMTLPALLRLFGEVLAALAAVHAIGIVHRDLKPDNIMVTRAGHAKVLDFGVAKLAPGVGGGLTPRTRDGVTVGTPAYMAPEQVIGAAIDARTDLYTMGIVMFEALTGRRPFEGTDLQLMRAHRDTPPPSPRALRPTLPAALEAVILRALHKDPTARYPDALAMAAAIASGLASTPEGPAGAEAVASRSTEAPTVRAKPALRPAASRVPAVLGVAAIAIAAAVVFVIARSRREDAPPAAAIVDAAIIDAAIVDTAIVDAALVPRDALAVVTDAAPEAAPGERRLPAAATVPVTESIAGDPRAFDPVGYVGTAGVLARRVVADAQPIFMFAERVDGSHHVDLTTYRVTYRFMAPGRAGSACMVVVEASSRGARARSTVDKLCATTSVGLPRCSIAQMRARLAGITAYAMVASGSAVYWKNGTWTFRGTAEEGSVFAIDLPDDC